MHKAHYLICLDNMGNCSFTFVVLFSGFAIPLFLCCCFFHLHFPIVPRCSGFCISVLGFVLLFFVSTFVSFWGFGIPLWLLYFSF